MPGVQMPHCEPLSSRNVRCKGCSSLPLAMPSMVSTSAPSASTASTRHEQTMTPSIMTVQAPQSPVPQPSLVPVSVSVSRSTSSSVCCGSQRYSYSSPLTVVVTCCFFAIYIFRFSLSTCLSLPAKRGGWLRASAASEESGGDFLRETPPGSDLRSSPPSPCGGG